MLDGGHGPFKNFPNSGAPSNTYPNEQPNLQLPLHSLCHPFAERRTMRRCDLLRLNRQTDT